jgi:hypothetical protein
MSDFDIERFISNNPNILQALYNDENSQITQKEFDDIPRNENYIKYQEKKELKKKAEKELIIEELDKKE